MFAYMYILKCAKGKYYTGSTKFLDRRIEEHQVGLGARFTKKHRPVQLVYFEEFDRIEDAFKREKQIQGWTHSKKKALIGGKLDELKMIGRKKFE
jgi:putative endonuclease